MFHIFTRYTRVTKTVIIEQVQENVDNIHRQHTVAALHQVK